MKISLLFLIIASVALLSSCEKSGSDSNKDAAAQPAVESSAYDSSKELKSATEMENILYENMSEFNISYVARNDGDTLDIGINDEDSKEKLVKFMEENDFDMDKIRFFGIVPNSEIDIAL